jgi:hypothetical protein
MLPAAWLRCVESSSSCAAANLALGQHSKLLLQPHNLAPGQNGQSVTFFIFSFL